MAPPPPYMDARVSPLNPCSIETIPIPIRLANGRSVWPMILSCYELTNTGICCTANTNNQSVSNNTAVSSNMSESQVAMKSTNSNSTDLSTLTSTETSSLTHGTSLSTYEVQRQQPTSSSSSSIQPPKQKRIGHMDVSLIAVPDNIAQTSAAMPLHFDATPTTLPQPDSRTAVAGGGGGGILDGQWSCMPPYMLQDINGSTTTNKNTHNTQNFCFASAHSTGEIQLHSLQTIQSSDTDHPSSIHDATNSALINVQFLAQSSRVTKSSSYPSSPNPLCLSLRWDTPAPYLTIHDPNIVTTTPTKIVSTYSNGSIAIHDVTVGTSHSDSGNNSSIKNVQLIEHDRWNAHTMFPTNTPAEVWTAAFVGYNNNSNTTNPNNVLWSGGDDGKLKIWDTRSTLRPMNTIPDLFDAGITCLAPHPTVENIVAVGSCTFFFPRSLVLVLFSCFFYYYIHTLIM
jgi:hypothetical protein